MFSVLPQQWWEVAREEGKLEAWGLGAGSGLRTQGRGP